jgi:hypothetical protein
MTLLYKMANLCSCKSSYHIIIAITVRLPFGILIWNLSNTSTLQSCNFDHVSERYPISLNCLKNWKTLNLIMQYLHSQFYEDLPFYKEVRELF